MDDTGHLKAADLDRLSILSARSRLLLLDHHSFDQPRSTGPGLAYDDKERNLAKNTQTGAVEGANWMQNGAIVAPNRHGYGPGSGGGDDEDLFQFYSSAMSSFDGNGAADGTGSHTPTAQLSPRQDPRQLAAYDSYDSRQPARK